MGRDEEGRGGVVSEVVAHDAERAGRVAERGGRRPRSLSPGEVRPQRLVLPLFRRAGFEEKAAAGSYVEGAAPKNPMLRRGYSRDHRPDCLQVVLAVIVNVDGFPLTQRP